LPLLKACQTLSNSDEKHQDVEISTLYGHAGFHVLAWEDNKIKCLSLIAS